MYSSRYYSDVIALSVIFFLAVSTASAESYAKKLSRYGILAWGTYPVEYEGATVKKNTENSSRWYIATGVAPPFGGEFR